MAGTRDKRSTVSFDPAKDFLSEEAKHKEIGEALCIVANSLEEKWTFVSKISIVCTIIFAPHIGSYIFLCLNWEKQVVDPTPWIVLRK